MTRSKIDLHCRVLFTCQLAVYFLAFKLYFTKHNYKAHMKAKQFTYRGKHYLWMYWINFTPY